MGIINHAYIMSVIKFAGCVTVTVLNTAVDMVYVGK